jgi:uncharacterized protein YhbP (UPF0306 family)
MEIIPAGEVVKRLVAEAKLAVRNKKTLFDHQWHDFYLIKRANTYHMSMFLLPKTVAGNIDKARRTFFWQGSGNKRKHHLVKWSKICCPKKKKDAWK